MSEELDIRSLSVAAAAKLLKVSPLSASNQWRMELPGALPVCFHLPPQCNLIHTDVIDTWRMKTIQWEAVQQFENHNTAVCAEHQAVSCFSRN